MSKYLTCPVCERGVMLILKWRGIYLCTPCKDKFEKIEKIIKVGQVLEGPRLESVLRYFGDSELEEIENSETVHLEKIKKRRRKRKA